MKFRAEVYTRKQLGLALDNSEIDKVYAPYNIVDESLLSDKDRIILVPPVFLSDCENELLLKLKKLNEIGFKNILVHTIGHIELFSEQDFVLYGGNRLNCINSDSIAFYSENKVNDIVVSPELTAFQINQLKKSCNIGFLAYGYIPLMITRRCPVKNGKPCNKECCRRTVKDRMDNTLNVICNENTAEILNSDVLYLADKLDSFRNADFAVLKFTVENDVDYIISAYMNRESPTMKDFTRGLYFRGIKGTD